MIRVVLPAHLKSLAQVTGEVTVQLDAPATQRTVLDALEAQYPVLCGTIRDRDSRRRRPYVRFFGGEDDLSHEPPDAPLPDTIVSGSEPFCVVGAMAGG